MSFEDLAKKFCEDKDNKDDERCACFNSLFPSKLKDRKGSEYKDSIQACYDPVCLASQYVPNDLKEAHDILKTCTNIYDLEGKTIKDEYGECSSAETSKYLLPVVNWSYDCDKEVASCSGVVCNPNTKDSQINALKNECPTKKGGGLAWWIILLIIIGIIMLIALVIFILVRRNRIKMEQFGREKFREVFDSGDRKTFGDNKITEAKTICRGKDKFLYREFGKRYRASDDYNESKRKILEILSKCGHHYENLSLEDASIIEKLTDPERSYIRALVNARGISVSQALQKCREYGACSSALQEDDSQV